MKTKQVIDWYRPTPLYQVLKTAGFSGFFMILGLLVMALGLDQSGRVPAEWQDFATVIGILMVIGGVSYASFHIWTLLQNDHFVLEVSNLGLSIYNNSQERFFEWKEISKTQMEDGQMVIYTPQEKIHVPHQFLGITKEQLTQRINDLQRKCLLGVLS